MTSFSTVQRLALGLALSLIVASACSRSNESGANTTAPGASSDAGPDATTADVSAGPCGASGESCCAGGTCTTAGLVCSGGTCMAPAAGNTGQPCTKNAQCPTGICQPVGEPMGGGPGWTGDVCTTQCTSTADCVAGWSCGPEPGQSGNVCQCTYSPEVCDGKDNDCNGIVDDEPKVDEECQSSLGSGAVCKDGACSCGGGTTMCGSSCVATQTDKDNCGACGKACPSAQSCVGGTCVCPASAPSFCADTGTCVNTQSDPDNCGSCSHACNAGATCVGGSCGCPSGTTLCGDACVDTQTDDNNCGTCGKACPAAQSCVGGTCSCPASTPTFCEASGECVDTQNDIYNCGGCYNICVALSATGNMCADGTCTDSVQGNYASCGGPGHTCSSASNCCGNECVGEACPPSPCQGGTCACVPSGQSCTTYEVCCSGGFCPELGPMTCP